jgi:uncharacterized phage protein (TIGR02220 family)
VRTYAKITSGLWIGPTGRQLRAAGAEVQVVAMYLMTSPHANMLGLYYLPIAFLAHETGLSPDAARRAIERATEIGFCDYDHASECVWIYTMARFQIGEQLEASDKRCRGVQKQYDDLPDSRFLRPFFERYAKTFHLSVPRDGGTSSNKLLSSSIEAPSKPLRSQEQEQEHEQEHEHEKEKTKALSGEAPDDSHSGNEKRQQAKALAMRIVAYLNKRAGTKYQGADAHLKIIAARALDGAIEAEMCAVIDAKVTEWSNDPVCRKWLSPDTLFNATKYPKYVGQLPKPAAPSLRIMVKVFAERGDGERELVVEYPPNGASAEDAARRVLAQNPTRFEGFRNIVLDNGGGDTRFSISELLT